MNALCRGHDGANVSAFHQRKGRNEVNACAPVRSDAESARWESLGTPSSDVNLTQTHIMSQVIADGTEQLSESAAVMEQETEDAVSGDGVVDPLVPRSAGDTLAELEDKLAQSNSTKVLGTCPPRTCDSAWRRTFLRQ